MTTKYHRGTGRKSVTKELERKQASLGLGKNKQQCLPTVPRNTEIDVMPNLLAAVFMKTREIKMRGFITEDEAIQAKSHAALIEASGNQMLYGKHFSKTANTLAILGFQANGYTAFGVHFEEEL